MKAAQINNLAGTDGHTGSYGSIKHGDIWSLVAKYQLDMLVVTLMVWDGTKFVKDPVACAPETREYVLGKGIQFGFSRAYNWGPQDPVWYANELHNDLNNFGLNNVRHPAADPCYVFANAEAHEFDVLTWLAAYRKKRPTRDTGWTIEGFQGGRISDTTVAKLNADTRLTTFGEAYRDNMYPQAQDAVKDDLRDRGLARVKLAYRANEGAPDGMDGILYTLEKLPL